MRPALLVMLVVAAAWMDVLTRRIPNALVIPGAVLGLAVAALSAGFPELRRRHWADWRSASR